VNKLRTQTRNNASISLKEHKLDCKANMEAFFWSKLTDKIDKKVNLIETKQAIQLNHSVDYYEIKQTGIPKMYNKGKVKKKLKAMGNRIYPVISLLSWLRMNLFGWPKSIVCTKTL